MYKLIILLLLCSPIYAQEHHYPLDLRRYNLELPSTDDPYLQKAMYSNRTVYYKLPQVYQFYQPKTQVVRSSTIGVKEEQNIGARYGLYYTTYLQEFNANTDFPWEATFGLSQGHRDNTHDAVNFIHLPSPVAIIDERPIKWIFPLGTIVGEIVFVKDGATKRVFEIRTREKIHVAADQYRLNDEITWDPKIFRPVSSAKELVRILRLPKEHEGKKFINLRNPEEDEVFHIFGNVEIIPDLTRQQTRYILSLPFKDVSETWWAQERDAFTPMSNQKFSIFPKDYAVGLLSSVDRVSCADCHRQTQISVFNLIPNERNIQRNQSKVGNIRGCDGIFTWYPMDRSAIGRYSSFQQGIKLRDYDFNRRLIERYNPAVHVEPTYQLTDYVKNSLQDWQLPVKYRAKLTHNETSDYNESISEVRYYNDYDRQNGYQQNQYQNYGY